MTKVDPDAIGPDGTVRLRSLNTQSVKAPTTGFLALCACASDAEMIQ